MFKKLRLDLLRSGVRTDKKQFSILPRSELLQTDEKGNDFLGVFATQIRLVDEDGGRRRTFSCIRTQPRTDRPDNGTASSHDELAPRGLAARQEGNISLN